MGTMGIFTFKFLLFFLLEQKETKIQEKVIGSRSMQTSPRYLFWPARTSECYLLCDELGETLWKVLALNQAIKIYETKSTLGMGKNMLYYH
jgi:hypothetical protein